MPTSFSGCWSFSRQKSSEVCLNTRSTGGGGGCFQGEDCSRPLPLVSVPQAENGPIFGSRLSQARLSELLYQPHLRPPRGQTGRSSAWLERLVWDQEVACSNHVAPISKIPLETRGFFFWADRGSVAGKYWLPLRCKAVFGGGHRVPNRRSGSWTVEGAFIRPPYPRRRKDAASVTVAARRAAAAFIWAQARLSEPSQSMAAEASSTTVTS